MDKFFRVHDFDTKNQLFDFCFNQTNYTCVLKNASDGEIIYDLSGPHKNEELIHPWYTITQVFLKKGNIKLLELALGQKLE